MSYSMTLPFPVLNICLYYTAYICRSSYRISWTGVILLQEFDWIVSVTGSLYPFFGTTKLSFDCYAIVPEMYCNYRSFTNCQTFEI